MRFALYHCGPDRVFWYATRNAPEASPDSPDGRKAEVRRLFQNWHQPIPEAIEATPGTAILRNDIVDRPPLSSLGPGPDKRCWAMRPIRPRPTSARAPARRWKTRWCWPTVYGGAERWNWLLRRYEQQRQRRTAGITRASWQIGKFCQSESPPVRWLLKRPDAINACEQQVAFHGEIRVS